MAFACGKLNKFPTSLYVSIYQHSLNFISLLQLNNRKHTKQMQVDAWSSTVAYSITQPWLFYSVSTVQLNLKLLRTPLSTL